MIKTRIWTLALALGALAAACGGAKEAAPPGGTAAAEKTAHACPPCGMELAADTELREIGGKKFAVCGDACAEKVTADPAKYAAYALP